MKPLFISNEFLRPNGPSALVERAFIDGLLSCGIEDIRIACSDYWRTNVFNEYTKKIPELVLLRYFLAILRKSGYHDIVNRPDPDWYSWGKNAVKRLNKHLKKYKYDYIHSFSLSCSNHLVALKLKELHRIPVITQFFDPWYQNPYRPLFSKKTKEYDALLERYVADKSDIIIHDNDRIAEVWIQRYGKMVENKIVVLPLVFNVPTLTDNDVNFPKPTKFIISHIGNFNSSRTSTSFIDALYLFVTHYPSLKDDVHVFFVGDVPQTQKDYIRQFGLDSLVTYTGSLTEKECYKYYCISDLFLAIDSVNELDVYFPSKLMKYFYFKKPILGITPKGSVMDNELKLSGNQSFRHSDISEISDFLYQNLTMPNDIYQTLNLDYWEKFTATSVAKKYLNIVNLKLPKK